MRLLIELELTRAATLPVNNNDLLQAVVYRLLGAANPDYARFLHAEGYTNAAPHSPSPTKSDEIALVSPETKSQDARETSSPLDHQPEPDAAKPDNRRFKLFTYSGLRAPASRRRVLGDLLHLAPGRVQWYVASPCADFLNPLVTGLLADGVLRVGNAHLPIATVSAHPAPDFAPPNGGDPSVPVTVAFTCLTPVVAAVPATDGRSTPRYLRPTEGDAFSEAVRKNLLAKYRVLHGHDPSDTRLRLTFSPGYLARDRHQGTKKITFGKIDMIGALVPLTLEAAPELLTLAWECGIGQGNSMGFGMLDVDARPLARDAK